MIPDATDLDDLAELFLAKRLSQLSRALELCQDEIEAEIADQKLSPGPMARRRLVAAWTELYARHGEQALADLVGLMRSFGAHDAATSLGGMLEAHLDAATQDLLRSLAACSFGGLSSGSAERKGVINLVSGIKRHQLETWRLEADRATREGQREGPPQSSRDDLDDRLPLNRRRIFDQDLPALAKAAKAADEPLGLIMADIDHFKRVNDEHGHAIGDEVLLEVAQLVVKRVAHKGRAYRFGGEELAVLLPAYSTDEAAGLAERLRKDLEARPMSARQLTVTASFGVASLPDDAGDSGRLLEKADEALYAAKHAGRNTVRSAAHPVS